MADKANPTSEKGMIVALCKEVATLCTRIEAIERDVAEVRTLVRELTETAINIREDVARLQERTSLLGLVASAIAALVSGVANAIIYLAGKLKG